MKLPDGWLLTPRLDVVSKKIVVEQSDGRLWYGWICGKCLELARKAVYDT